MLFNDFAYIGTASSQGTVYKAVRSQPAVAQAGTRLAQMHISSGPRICPKVTVSTSVSVITLTLNQNECNAL